MDRKAVALSIMLVSVSSISTAHAAAENGSVYVGAKGGWSSYHDKKIPVAELEGNKIKADKFGYGAYAGFQVHPNVAFEAAYDNLGKVDYKKASPAHKNGSFETQGLQFAAKLSTAITDDIDIYGRMGTMVWRSKRKIGDNSHKQSGVSPLIAAGIEIALTKSLAARLDYQWVENVGKEWMKIRADNGMLSVGMAYRLNQSSKPETEITEVPQIGAIAPPLQPPLPPTVNRVETRGPIRVTYENKVVKLQTEVLFEFNKHTLTEQGREILDRLVFELNTFKFAEETMFIIGYTDRLGSKNYNQELSDRRSTTVVRYLTNKGVSQEKINSIGLGADNSLMGGRCDTSLPRPELIECLTIDRRVEIEIAGVNEDDASQQDNVSESMSDAIMTY